MTTDVIGFISRFHNTSKTNDVDEVFTCGCCYWFAYVLCERFKDARMMYDPVMNHFMVGYHGKLFDVTGDVTKEYDAIEWSNFDDDLERQRIIEYCVDFNE